MYSTAGYGEMIADEERMRAYAAALKRVVGPDSVVLDLGSGSGIMAFQACRLGVRKVIAVEPDGVVQLARRIAEANGLATRIEFLYGLSTTMEPSRLCDVVVSDLRGVLPLFARHIPTIVDVRERWLVKGGIQIPCRDSIFAAVIESQSLWDRHFRGWTANVGVDFSPALQVRSGCTQRATLGSETMLTEPALWASIDYRTVSSPNYEGLLSWDVNREGTGHGIALWFESVLADGVTLSNRPGEPPLIYGQQYFPWPQSVALHAGDRIEARIRAYLVGDDYTWAWDTDVHPAGTDSVLRTFRQSTLQGVVCTSESLASLRLNVRQALTAKGRAALEVLRAMERGATAGEISLALVDRFSAEFPELQHAVNFVSGLRCAFGIDPVNTRVANNLANETLE